MRRRSNRTLDLHFQKARSKKKPFARILLIQSQELDPNIKRYAQTKCLLAGRPSVRLSVFAIFPARVLFRASVFKVRTSAVVHERRLPFFIVYSLSCEVRRLPQITEVCQSLIFPYGAISGG